MIFSSFEFIFLFLPVVWLGYFGLHRLRFHRGAKYFLVFASFLFYAIGSPRFVLIFMASVTVNYLIGTRLSLLKKQPSEKYSFVSGVLFSLGIILNCALLFYYKYTDFFISNFNAVFAQTVPLLHIALPIGISFFTFQLVAYLADSYRGLTAQYSFLDYLLFISFFPQLIVGPIVHHSEMVPQFEAQGNWSVNWDNVAKGIFVFSIGAAKKTLLANPLTANAQSFFDTVSGSVSALSAWWYSVEYTVSYYFDLSGYADMAIGIALLFNIVIPENFNSPYKARNFQDYWQRWHITLSRFLGAYIFRSVYRKDSAWRNYYVATMVTFLVSGFWHGAGWTFAAWGIINGILVCAASWMRRRNLAFPAPIARILTLLGIVLTRILFVAKDFSQAAAVFKSLLRFDIGGFPVGADVSALMVFRLAAGCAIIFFMPSTRTLADRFSSGWKTLVPTSLAAGLSVAFMGRASPFLYFQF